MTWFQLELRAHPEQLPEVEEALFDAAAVSITLLSDANEPVLEPAPGEVPLWSSVRVQALLPVNVDIGALREALNSCQAWQPENVNFEFVVEEDWQVAASNHAVNAVFGNRLWLLPKGAELDEQQIADAKAKVKLRLDPGLAFGSGSHPTTRLCLEWLAQHITAGQKVLDFGCGSGVLGIAAALLGAQVVAVDHDDQAVMATSENAAFNQLDSNQLVSLSTRDWQAGDYRDYFDVVVANILAAPLQSLADQFEQVVVPGGNIVLSGVLSDQADDVMAAYAHTSFKAPWLEAGWACLIGDINTP